MQAKPLVQIKLCGLNGAADVAAANSVSADYVGFVFVQKSPRWVTPARAAPLAAAIAPGTVKVGLVVNPTDADLDDILALVDLDMIQLHGSESPDRVAQVKTRTGLPVMKAVGIAAASDVDKARTFEAVADQLLLDAKPASEEMPGGNGVAFDWRLLDGQEFSVPWMLAGGLDPTNVAHAVRLTSATMVDVSSGIEAAPGQKDPAKIKAFANAARGVAGTASI